MCKFCSDECTEKSIRDQIIEGTSDSDTIVDLLQENNLTLARTISMCRSQEAAKKHRSDIHAPALKQGMVASLQQRSHVPPQLCLGCGSHMHKGGHRQYPAYNQVCMSTSYLQQLAPEQ